jgi:sugar lactone lactonase YvrE
VAKLLGGVTLAAGLLGAHVANAGDINFTAPATYPESITWSAHQHVFLVGSVKHGNVGKITPDGRYSVFIHDDRLVSTLGLLVDDKRNTLWVTNADPGPSERSSDATRGKLAGIATYDATTGKPRAYYDLSALEPGAHLANDLALDADGNAYVTDSFAPLIYRIDTQGHASIFARDDRFNAGKGFNLNGIVMHPDGYLLVDLTNSGQIFKIDIHDPRKVSEVKLPEALVGADGLNLRDPQHLIVAQNAGVDRTVELTSTDGWQTASIVRTQKSEASMPTASVTENGKVYVLNSRIDTLFKPGSPKVDHYVLQQF